jgi:valyl-tRNA synthetase
MPFVTEEIWQRLNASARTRTARPALIVAAYPQPAGRAARAATTEAERQLGPVQEFVRAIRNIRAEKRVDAGRWVEAYIVAGDAAETARSLTPRSRCSPAPARCTSSPPPRRRPPRASSPASSTSARSSSPWPASSTRTPSANASEADREAEPRSRRQEAKLANEAVHLEGPGAVVAKERERLETARTRLEGLRASLAELG